MTLTFLWNFPIFVLFSIQFTVIFTYNVPYEDYPRLELQIENLSSNNPQIINKSKFEDAFATYLSAKRNFTNDVLVYSINSGHSSVSGASEPRYDDSDTNIQPLNSWSVIWYVGSFGGLIGFFLIVSCSEWCCRRHARNRCSAINDNADSTTHAPDTPPPSYDQFAPPSYESLINGGRGEKSEYDVYVVPVHALGTMIDSHQAQVGPQPHEDAPPSYLAVSQGCIYPAYPPSASTVLSIPSNIPETSNTIPSASASTTLTISSEPNRNNDSIDISTSDSDNLNRENNQIRTPSVR